MSSVTQVQRRLTTKDAGLERTLVYTQIVLNVGWAKRSVPTISLIVVGTLRFAHPTSALVLATKNFLLLSATSSTLPQKTYVIIRSYFYKLLFSKDNPMEENKKKALAAALSQIERQFGKGSVMRLGDASHRA